MPSFGAVVRQLLPRTLLWACCLVLCGAGPALAQGSDVKGSKDHPLVSRYAGSTILGYEERAFDDYTLILGPTKRSDQNRMQFVPSKQQKIEGKLTRVLYVAPEGRASLEILRNYEQALTKAGFKTMFTCTGAECAPDPGWLRFSLYDGARKFTNSQAANNAFSFPKDDRYLATKLTRAEGDVYVSLYVAIETFDAVKEIAHHPVALLEVIETKPMESNLVTVDAAAMAKDIDAAGHVALYGLYFDTNSATIKPESSATLQEIATLLKQDAKLRLFVVGHTDNVGGHQYNMDLSQRRAASVVAALSGQHGIDAKRLTPAGVGLLAPVASNATEAGRAKNRRVDLVKQ